MAPPPGVEILASKYPEITLNKVGFFILLTILSCSNPLNESIPVELFTSLDGYRSVHDVARL